MKNYLTIVVLLSSVSIAFSDGDTENIEGIREKLLYVRPEIKQKIPADILDEHHAIIRDDSSPIDIGEIKQLFSDPPETKKQSQRRECLIEALTFRERSNPKTLVAIFDKLSFSERNRILGMYSTMLRPNVNHVHVALLLKGLDKAIQDAERMAKEVNVQTTESKERPSQSSIDYLPISWLRLVALTDDPKAVLMVKKIIEQRVKRPMLRFNLVSVATSSMGAGALPLARWYFENYAWRPVHIAVVAAYLRKYDHPTTSGALLENKKATLQKSLQALEPNYDIGIPKASQPQSSDTLPPPTNKESKK